MEYSRSRTCLLASAVITLLALSLCPLRAGVTTRVSVASDGAQGNGDSGGEWPYNHNGLSVTADGRYVAFESYASNLVPGDTNGEPDIFVYDRQTGYMERISVQSDGAQANCASHQPCISADGHYIAFTTCASLLADDTNHKYDVYVHDMQMDWTIRVSKPNSGGEEVEGDDSSGLDGLSISGDGRYVAFQSWAHNLIPGEWNSGQIYLRDRQNGETTIVSVASDGTKGNSFSTHPAMSVDGRYVAFYSYSSNLVPGDTNGAVDIFVRDRQTGQTARVSVASDGTEANGSSGYDRLSISADGRFVAFYSYASNLVPSDTNGDDDVFVHDRQTGQTIRVSVASDGTEGNSFSSDPAISADGRYVTFESLSSNLVPGDTNGSWDVFVHDRQTGQTTRVSVASDGAQGNGYYPSISADGRFVAFESYASNLVAGDTNGRCDVFVHDRTPTPILVLVRGLQFAGSTDAESYWSDLKCKLQPDFDVWVCDTITGMEGVKDAAGRLHTFIQGRLGQRAQGGLPPPKSISIVAHSYGGLISRLFLQKYCDKYGSLPLEVGGTAKIDKVIMLSTPNCGSLLADIGMWPGVFTGSFAALSCLTTDFVQKVFNPRCPALPPPAPFHLFSGDGSSGLGGYWLPHEILYWLPPGLGDENDGIVTVDSAHGWRRRWRLLPPAVVREQQVGGACYWTGANHTTVRTSASVLDAVRSLLLGEGVSTIQLYSQIAEATPTTPSVVAAVDDGTIVQDQTAQVTVTVDDCPQAAFALDYAAGNVAFTLTAPTGGTIDPASPDPSVHYSKTADEAGVHESYLIDNPALGAWTMNLTGTSVDPAGALWNLMVSEESNLGLTSTTEYFQSAGNVIVSAGVMDGTQPVTGAAVSADVRRPDDTVDQLTLYDDGAHADGATADGLYANLYAQSTPGIYGVKYSATGTNLQGHAFSRIEGDTLQIAPQTATLPGVYSDHGEDTGPPPGLENIVVDVGVQALSEGNYAVSAKLADAQGNPLVATSASATGVSAGPATISLKFDGDVLRRSSVDGPYKLVDVELWDESGEMPLRADHADSPYTTGPYERSQFSDQYPPDPVQDLTVVAVDPGVGSVTLRWSAPSSEGAPAVSYDVRYSTGGLNSEVWDSATVLASPPAPAAPGVLQTLTVSALPLGQTYFFGLKSRDQVGNESPLSNIADVYLGSQLDMRNSPDGTYGVVIGVVAATSGDVGATYVESEGRSWGVRVDDTPATESHKVYVTGLLTTQGGERMMESPELYDLGPASPIRPLAVSGRVLARPGIGAQGPETAGLLVRIWGKVTQVGVGYMYVNDGANLLDGTLTGSEENVGVRVLCDPTGYNTGDVMAVTGISSCFDAGSGNIARRILTRRSSDIKRLVPGGASVRTIGEAKAAYDGASVSLTGKKVTGVFAGYFYVEETDRSSGVRVISDVPVSEGQLASVAGVLRNTDGEREILASSVTRSDDPGFIDPLGMQSRFTGGGGLGFQPGVVDFVQPTLWQQRYSTALNNIGLLVTTWGRVTGKGDGYLYVDDGTTLRDGTLTGEDEDIGVRVICDPASYSAGDFLIVTGISSCFETTSGQIARRVLTRRSEDIHKAYP